VYSGKGRKGLHLVAKGYKVALGGVLNAWFELQRLSLQLPTSQPTNQISNQPTNQPTSTPKAPATQPSQPHTPPRTSAPVTTDALSSSAPSRSEGANRAPSAAFAVSATPPSRVVLARPAAPACALVWWWCSVGVFIGWEGSCVGRSCM